MTVFKDAADWLHGKRLAHAVLTVSYGRASLGVPSQEMEAQVGKTVYEDVDENNIVTRYESRDYIIAISEFDGIITGPPEIGDTISEVQDLVTYRYEVAMVSGEQHYRRDAHRNTYRIHTKRISGE